MAIIYSMADKTARMDATRARYANGTLEIGTAGMAAVLVTFTFSASAGSVVNDIWTMGFAAGTLPAANAGIAAAARLKTSGGTVGVTGLTVAKTGADINLVNTDIAATQPVTLTSGTFTHAA